MVSGGPIKQYADRFDSGFIKKHCGFGHSDTESLYVSPFLFFFFLSISYLFERQRDLSSMGSLPNWPQWAGEGGRSLFPVFHVSVGAQTPEPPSATFLCSLAGSWIGSGELDSNWHLCGMQAL